MRPSRKGKAPVSTEQGMLKNPRALIGGWRLIVARESDPLVHARAAAESYPFKVVCLSSRAAITRNPPMVRGLRARSEMIEGATRPVMAALEGELCP